MIRCLVRAEQIQGERVSLDPRQTKHLVTVLRLCPGDDLIVVSDSGSYQAVLESVQGRRSVLRLLGSAPLPALEPWQIHLAVAVPHRPSAFDQIVDQATQLGVASIIPVVTARSVARPKQTEFSQRFKRWQQLVNEATEQCGRPAPPMLSPVLPLSDLCDRYGRTATWLIPTLECGQRKSLAEAVAATSGAGLPWLLFIGPEGDFTGQEVDQVAALGGHAISLGPLTLRTETAAIAGLGMLVEALRENQNRNI